MKRDTNLAPVPQELVVDASYRNTNDWNRPPDVFNRFFRFDDGKGINNTSGFRPKSRSRGSTDIVDCAFCVLVTNYGETEWPDALDHESGVFTYYGDNRAAGKRLDETAVGGNRLLEHVFSNLHLGVRDRIPPFLCFEKYKEANATWMRFLGLAAPGARNVSAFDDLVAVWRVKDTTRFQNYKATFTVLRAETVSHQWLADMVAGLRPAESTHAPGAWSRWVASGAYDALTCERKIVPRSRTHQLPSSAKEWTVLKTVSELTDREFEFAAADLVRYMDERFVDLHVTRGVRDGGRDVIGSYRVGHALHQVMLRAAIEAKRWSVDSAVGVKPMMRLISRLKHRDVGVFVTTSFFDTQVQQELIDDGHPVILVSGGDIARLLIAREMSDTGAGCKLASWLESIRSRAAA